MVDRRAAPRLPAGVSIGVQSAGRVEMARSRDFSVTGVFVETRVPLALGAPVELFLMPPNSSQALRLNGVVARAAPGGVGIAFLPPAPEAREALERFLASLEPAPQHQTELPEEFNPHAIEAAIRKDKEEHLRHAESAQQLHASGQKALASGRWTHAAIALLERAIELSPTTAAYHHDLGTAYYQIGDIERAVKEFDKALQLEPEEE